MVFVRIRPSNSTSSDPPRASQILSTNWPLLLRQTHRTTNPVDSSCTKLPMRQRAQIPARSVTMNIRFAALVTFVLHQSSRRGGLAEPGGITGYECQTGLAIRVRSDRGLFELRL